MFKSTLLTGIVILLTAISLNGQLAFSEVMAVNANGLINPVTEDADDWIEIYNGTQQTVDMSPYALSDNPGEPLKWYFPEGILVGPGEYLLIWADGTDHRSDGCHTNFKLDVKGEPLFLHNINTGELIDSLTYPPMHEDISFGYSPDNSRLYFQHPTPGQINDSASGFLYSAGVTIDPPAAIFESVIPVTITPSAPGIIRYTLDGSVPGLQDPVYHSPLYVKQSVVIRARLWQEGFEPGAVSTSSFLLHKGITLPVISLSTNPVHFFSDTSGVYVEGTNGRIGYCSEVPVNWNMDWERPISFEYFDQQGVRQLQQDGGTRIHGGCSRLNPIKSLAFFARDKYGNDKMEYPFFSEREYNRQKGLILRNSGNDCQYTFFRDAMIQAVVSPVMNLDYQAYELVHVYLNGADWGLHNLREKINEHWVTSNYGIDADEIDFIKNRSEVFAGSMEGMDSLNLYLENHSLAGEEQFNWVAEQIDLDSYTDYLITQMFFANRDWPGNNAKCWRERKPGSKWRYILFDLDFTMGIYDFNPSINMFAFSTANDTDDWPNPRWATLPIRKLLENQGFRDQFIQRYLMHMNTTLHPERVNHAIDSFYYSLENLMPAQIERWKRPWNIDFWNQHVDLIREFANKRPAHVRQNMRDFFLQGREISLQFEPSDGSFQMNANNVAVPMSGMNGYYLEGTDLHLDCSVSPGYRFSHWEVSSTGAENIQLVPAGSSWKYNDTGNDPGTGWEQSTFDDALWPEGAGELGYGDGNENTLLDFGENPDQKHITSYFRKVVEIENPGQFGNILLRVMRDDGIIVYVNGNEIMRDNMPEGEVNHLTMASTAISGEEERSYNEFLVDPVFFKDGSNQLAVEVHQISATSSDISFDMELLGNKTGQAETETYSERQLTLQPPGNIIVRAVTEETNLDPEVDLYINEFMASNVGAYLDASGNDPDWVEVYNGGEREVDLAGFYLTDNQDMPTKWQIPENLTERTTLQAGEYMLFIADGASDSGPLHTNFKLSASGEFIGLNAVNGSMVHWIDSISFQSQLTNVSFGRIPDGSSQWLAMETYTPGASNQVTHTLQHPQQNQFELFPNPTSDRLNIRFICNSEYQGGQLKLVLYDLTGRRAFEGAVEGWNGTFAGGIDISSVPAGVYLLSAEYGKFRYTKKIIKQGS